MNRVPLRIVDAPDSGEDPASPELSRETLRLAWASIVRARALGEAAASARSADVAAVPPPDEVADAIAVGIALAAGPADWIYTAPGDAVTGWMRGIPPASVAMQAALGGGAGRRMPGLVGSRERRVVPALAGVGSRLLTALGTALAVHAAEGASRGAGRRERGAVVCTIGARSMVRGAFATAWRSASKRRAPWVVVARPGTAAGSSGNGATFPSSLPLESDVFGAWSRTVDGGDALAMAAACGSAIDAARRGEGPSLLVAAATAGAPATRLAAFLRDRHGFGDEELAAIETEVKSEVASEFDALGSAVSKPAFDSMFDDVYESVPGALLEQRRLGSTASTEYAS